MGSGVSSKRSGDLEMKDYAEKSNKIDEVLMIREELNELQNDFEVIEKKYYWMLILNALFILMNTTILILISTNYYSKINFNNFSANIPSEVIGSIDGRKILDESITNSKILNGTIEYIKIKDLNGEIILPKTIDGDSIKDSTIHDSSILNISGEKIMNLSLNDSNILSVDGKKIFMPIRVLIFEQFMGSKIYFEIKSDRVIILEGGSQVISTETPDRSYKVTIGCCHSNLAGTACSITTNWKDYSCVKYDGCTRTLDYNGNYVNVSLVIINDDLNILNYNPNTIICTYQYQMLQLG